MGTAVPTTIFPLNPYSLKPITDAVVGFFIACFAIIVPLVAIIDEPRTVTVGTGVPSGQLEKQAQGH